MKLPAPTSATEAVIDAVAVYRLTRLLQVDEVPPVHEIRDAVLDRWGDTRLGEGLSCPWCLSVWIGLGVTVARARFPSAWPIAARVLAGSAVAGLLSGWER